MARKGTRCPYREGQPRTGTFSQELVLGQSLAKRSGPPAHPLRRMEPLGSFVLWGELDEPELARRRPAPETSRTAVAVYALAAAVQTLR